MTTLCILGTSTVIGGWNTSSLGLAMLPGTSPSITQLADGGYEVAFQSGTGALSAAGDVGTGPVTRRLRRTAPKASTRSRSKASTAGSGAMGR